MESVFIGLCLEFLRFLQYKESLSYVIFYLVPFDYVDRRFLIRLRNILIFVLPLYSIVVTAILIKGDDVNAKNCYAFKLATICK